MPKRHRPQSRHDTADRRGSPIVQDLNGARLSDNQTKRRPHSGQEARDGARLDPSNREDPHLEYPASRQASPWLDVIAFLGVLATGCILIIFGHLTAGSLATACGVLIGLFAAWRNLRTPPPPRRLLRGHGSLAGLGFRSSPRAGRHQPSRYGAVAALWAT
jgi:hypothetical protein